MLSVRKGRRWGVLAWEKAEEAVLDRNRVEKGQERQE